MPERMELSWGIRGKMILDQYIQMDFKFCCSLMPVQFSLLACAYYAF